MDRIEIERRVVGVIEVCGGKIPSDQLVEMRQLAMSGEPGVAYENLCVQLYEYDASVSADLSLELRVLADAMGLKDKYWARLRVT